MSGINDKHHFHAHGVHSAGKDKAKGKSEQDAPSEALAQATPRFEGKTPEAIFAALSKSGSSAQLGVLAQRVQAGLANFPSPEKFAALEGKIRAEFPGISDSALSGVAADLLIGKVAVNA